MKLALAPGLLLIAEYLLFRLAGAGGPRFNRLDAAALLAGVALLGAGLLSRRLLRRRRALHEGLALACASAILCYGLAEAAASFYAWRKADSSSCFLFENSQRTVRFDPVLGFKLSRTPSRYARLVFGRPEYSGILRGNSLGLPDRDDFGPKRSSPGEYRVAVFGDSFTSAQYLKKNWPDAAEDLAARSGRPVKFLNFSVAGAGLANWRSAIRGLLEPGGFQLNAVVFAVYNDDLFRKFTFADHSLHLEHRLGRCASWSPEACPATAAEADRLLASPGPRVATAADFDLALRTGVCPAGSPPALFRAELTARAERLYRRLTGAERRPPPSDPQRLSLMDDIARYVKDNDLKAHVFFLPEKDLFCAPSGRRTPLVADAMAFAERLGATFTDARVMPGPEKEDCSRFFFAYDGHWNQHGSDRFAALALRTVEEGRAAQAPAPGAAP